MNSNNPGSINGPTPNNNFPVTAPLSDKGRQGDVDLGSQSDLVSTGENIDSSAITVDPTIPELSVAYNRTFLQIPPPSLPKKEMLAQLEPFSKTVAADLNASLSQYVDEEANVQASTDILNVIEKAIKAGQNNREHYGPTGINAEVTQETSPMGSQGVSEQDALLHSLGNITLTALIAPARENFSSNSLKDPRRNWGFQKSSDPSQGVGSHGIKSNIELTGSTSPITADPGQQMEKIFSTIGSLNQLLNHQNNQGSGRPATVLSTSKASESPKLKNFQETSSQRGLGNDYNSETEQISHQFLAAEEENSFENANGLNRMMARNEAALVTLQADMTYSLHHSLQESLETLKGLINNPLWATAVAA